MHSDKNREARPEPWRGISVEKKPTNKPKKDQKDPEGNQEKNGVMDPKRVESFGKEGV